MRIAILSHSKRSARVATGIAALPPIEAGTSEPDKAATFQAIADFVASRTFTQTTWGNVAWSPTDRIRHNTGDSENCRLAGDRVLKYFESEFQRHGLSSANGLRDVTFQQLLTVETLRSATFASSGIRNHPCNGANDILASITAEFKDYNLYPGDNKMFWAILDGTDIYREVDSRGTFADFEALKKASPAIWMEYSNYKNAHEYVLVAGNVWEVKRNHGYQQFYYEGETPWWRNASNIPPGYPWVNRGPLVTSIAEAVALGPIAAGSGLAIRGMGAWRNDTGSPATFDINAFTMVHSKSGSIFIACQGGRNATSYIGVEAAQWTDTVHSTQIHEVGHVFSLQHSRYGENGTTSIMASSGLGGGESRRMTFGQAVVAYLHDSAIGVSNVPSDQVNPIWTLSDLVVGASSDGSLHPTMHGKVATNNQASVPIVAMVAYIEKVKDDYTSDNAYVYGHVVGCLVAPDGTFKLKLEHPLTSGKFRLMRLMGYNLAGKNKVFDISSLVPNNDRWSL